MNDFNRAYSQPVSAGSMDTSVNAGLRAFMLGVYQKLALGIALAGALAWFVGASIVPSLTELVLFSPLRLVIQFAPIVLILGAAFMMRKPSPLATGILYWTIVTLLGLSLAIWFYAATANIDLATRAGRTMTPAFMTIAKAFFLTASAFGALSLFGYTTKMDLKPVGVAAFFGLWAVVGVGVISLFFPPSGLLEMALMVGVLVISGVLVAWDTQELKQGYFAFEGDERGLAVMTNWGALNFFILFYNMFTVLLSLLSSD